MAVVVSESTDSRGIHRGSVHTLVGGREGGRG